MKDSFGSAYYHNMCFGSTGQDGGGGLGGVSMGGRIANHGDGSGKSNVARMLLLAAGIIYVLSSVLYNEYLVARFLPNRALDYLIVERVRSVQVCFLVAGLMLISASELVRRISRLRAFMSKRLVAKILLCVLTTVLPVSILELSLRPAAYCSANTTIFVRDRELGWRLKPDSEDVWGGVQVKVNGKGLIGPELDYDKRPEVIRILYLGDSVTFGYRLSSYKQTFPYAAEAILEKELGKEIETINAGVGGYSPWQEYIYLYREGIKYSPDLVVICFVLNDVTEKFGLVRFGGLGEGLQLSKTGPALDRLLSKSGIMYLARKINAKIRFGRDVQKGATKREILDVHSLVERPDSRDVEAAWRITLRNLGKIFDLCRDKGISVILVVFPFSFQFSDVNNSSIPQAIVSQYAVEHGIPVIDLLPILSEKITKEGTKPEDYFLDHDHLSLVGSEVVAEIVSDFMSKERLLSP